MVVCVCVWGGGERWYPKNKGKELKQMSKEGTKDENQDARKKKKKKKKNLHVPPAAGITWGF